MMNSMTVKKTLALPDLTPEELASIGPIDVGTEFRMQAAALLASGQAVRMVCGDIWLGTLYPGGRSEYLDRPGRVVTWPEVPQDAENL